MDLKEAVDNFDRNSTQEKARIKLEKFVERWKKEYGKAVNKWLEKDFMDDYLTYTNYPLKVRRMIYTTNAIENLNREVRRVTKTKATFDKEPKSLALVFIDIKDFQCSNSSVYPVQNFQFWNKKNTIKKDAPP